MQLYYWGIRARNFPALVLAKAGGIAVEEVKEFDWPALKPSTPFGQLPYLVDGDVKLAQSGAIVNYIAHKANLRGSTDAEVALSEMLSAEAWDLYSILAKANSGSEKAAAYDAIFAADGALTQQFHFLERLHPDGQPLFVNASQPVAGGYVLACMLNIIVTLQPTALDAFPKLKLFYETVIALPAFDGVKDYPMYFSRS